VLAALESSGKAMIVETLPVGMLQCNCTILGCEDTKEAIVVDPGGDIDRITEILKHHDLTVKKIIHTHAHIDHVWGTAELHEKVGGEVSLHPGDVFLYENLEMQGNMLGIPAPTTTEIKSELKDNELLKFGNGYALVLHTPGHTPGSVCFCVRRKANSDNSEEQILLSGDTLFRRGIGRTDLWGGDQNQIFESIKDRLFSLEDDTRVIPGHGPETHIGEERTNNPFLS
jgi:hydroxyacylglutathione hydrolase